jgi:putative oxidoreductase
MFAHWGYPAWFATLIGVLELTGAVGLLIPRTTRYAVWGLTVIMLGAAYTHLASHEGIQVLRPVIFLAVLWAIWWLRRPVDG